MTSFVKKLKKGGDLLDNAVVLGTAFGKLDEVLDGFRNVFVFNDVIPVTKRKNLVYRENFKDLNTINEVSHVFIDLNKVSSIPEIHPILTRFHVKILVEGEDVIERPEANSLWNIHYIPIEKLKFYHLWIKKT